MSGNLPFHVDVVVTDTRFEIQPAVDRGLTPGEAELLSQTLQRARNVAGTYAIREASGEQRFEPGARYRVDPPDTDDLEMGE